MNIFYTNNGIFFYIHIDFHEVGVCMNKEWFRFGITSMLLCLMTSALFMIAEAVGRDFFPIDQFRILSPVMFILAFILLVYGIAMAIRDGN